jgi:serine protease
MVTKLSTYTTYFGLFLLPLFGYADTRLIIKYKPSIEQSKLSATGEQLSATALKQISVTSGMNALEVSRVGNGAHVIQLKGDATDVQVQQVIDKLQKDPNVDYVEIDHRLKANGANRVNGRQSMLLPDRVVNSFQIVNSIPIPNPLQWNMNMVNSSNLVNDMTWYGDNFQAAWTSSQGSGTIIAELDTGYTPHNNIIGNLQKLDNVSCISDNGYNGTCYGYQFISDCRIAGGRCGSVTTYMAPRPDGLDTGDYVTEADMQLPVFAGMGCEVSDSDWHGTFVAGVMVGSGYDGTTKSTGGVVGGAPAAMLIPIRVLGRCGVGYDSDIANGVLWAVGKLSVSGEVNDHPAQVINMSLGGTAQCSHTMQAAIDTANNNGAIVVVAAGNEGLNTSTSSPANCHGVIVVSAAGPLQDLSWYSNWGGTTITASGGNSIDSRAIDSRAMGSTGSMNAKIWSSTWGSQLAYKYISAGSQFTYLQGTSFAAPAVSAAIADTRQYLSTNYNVGSVMQILQNSAASLDNTNNIGYGNSSGIGNSSGGGYVTNLRLDTEAAVNYASNVSQGGSAGMMLIPSANPSQFAAVGAINTIKFTNNGINVAVGSVKISDGSVFSVVTDNCTGETLAKGDSCSVAVTQTAASTAPATLQLLAGTTVVATTVLVYGVTVSGSATNGGGCAMVQGGDDLSLLLVLAILAGWYLFLIRYLKGRT